MNLQEENARLRQALENIKLSADWDYNYELRDFCDTALSHQDKRESEINHIELCITNLKAEHQSNPKVIAEVLHNIGYSRSRPAQTAPQPAAWKARCTSMAPGLAEVTLRVDAGLVPGFMDPGREVYVSEAAPVAQPEQQPVPDAVWEALQRMIESTELMGPHSREDALLVARYRDRYRLFAAPSDE